MLIPGQRSAASQMFVDNTASLPEDELHAMVDVGDGVLIPLADLLDVQELLDDKDGEDGADFGMTANDFDTEQRLGIRAHYITGRHDLETALTRIQNGGFTQLTREQAAEILRQPITAETVKTFTGRDVTDEQIAARLAEVTA